MEEVKDLKELAAKLRGVNEFAVKLDSNDLIFIVSRSEFHGHLHYINFIIIAGLYIKVINVWGSLLHLQLL